MKVLKAMPTTWADADAGGDARGGVRSAHPADADETEDQRRQGCRECEEGSDSAHQAEAVTGVRRGGDQDLEHDVVHDGDRNRDQSEDEPGLCRPD